MPCPRTCAGGGGAAAPAGALLQRRGRPGPACCLRRAGPWGVVCGVKTALGLGRVCGLRGLPFSQQQTGGQAQRALCVGAAAGGAVRAPRAPMTGILRHTKTYCFLPIQQKIGTILFHLH